MSAVADPNVMPFSGQDIRWLISAQARQRADHPFLIWEPLDGRTELWTYAMFADRVARVAAGLAARGVRSSDRVIVHLDNCPQLLFAWFGCAWLGAVAVTTNARSTADDLTYFSGHSRAVGAITQPRFAELVATSCKDVAWLAVTETDNGDDPGANRPAPADSFERLDGDPSSLPHRAADPLHPFAIQYTSGTTSRPKAVLWTHANALWGARINADHETLRADDVHNCVLPLFHTNAQAYSVLATLWAGASCVIQPRFSASRFWPISLKHRCTWASMVPFCTRALGEQPIPEAHSYRLWGGVACDPPTDRQFRVRTIGWWGMTETITQGILGHAAHPNTPLSIGRPAPEYDIRILNDRGLTAEPGETGDLSIRGVRGLSLFAEYAGDPQATAAAFDDEGYFATGDRVTLQADGSIVFADRSKDMLKVGGENVAASEIERVIMTVSGVREAAVVAKKHPMYDEVPVAFVIPLALEAPDGDLVEAIMAVCRTQLAKFKVPHEVRLVESLPRSTLEKIAKAELRRLLQ